MMMQRSGARSTWCVARGVLLHVPRCANFVVLLPIARFKVMLQELTGMRGVHICVWVDVFVHIHVKMGMAALPRRYPGGPC